MKNPLKILSFIITISLSTFIQAQTPELWGMTSTGGEQLAGTIFKTDLDGNNHDIQKNLYKYEGARATNGTLLKANNGKLYGTTQLGGDSNYDNYGLLFEYDPTSDTYTKKVNFNGSTNNLGGIPIGKQPTGSLIQASNGKLYGLTKYGGLYNSGILYEYDINSNTITKKIDFDSISKGQYPNGGLIQISNGKLYGRTSGGGLNNLGVLFEYNPSNNTFIKKIDFDSIVNGRHPAGSLVQANNGKLYGMTLWGGSTYGPFVGDGVICEYDPTTNTYTKKIDLIINTTGRLPRGTLLKASNGMLYGATYSGGTNNGGVLFEYNPTTNIIIPKVNFDGTNKGRGSHGHLIQAINGNIYGTTYYGGLNGNPGYGVLFEYNINTNTYTKKLDFDSINGKNPIGSLVQLSNNSLYGITSLGGVMNEGAFFEYNISTNILNKKFDLQSSPEGTEPMSSLLKADNNKLYGVTAYGGAYDKGVLFEFNPNTNIYTNLYDFDSTINGVAPINSLIQATNGKLYGNANGGLFNKGVIFEYDINSNIYQKKIDISDSIGSFSGALMQASNGKLYGTSAHGGIYDDGTLFEYNIITNIITKKIDFNKTQTGEYPCGHLLQAANGKLYGMTYKGGANNDGILFEYNNQTNSLTKKIDFNESTIGESPQGTLIQTSNGILYGMTQTGGANDHGVLFEYNIPTNTLTNKLNFIKTAKGMHPFGDLLQASNGNLYGMTRDGGTHNQGVIFEYNPTLNTYTKKLDFDKTNGSKAFGSLIEISVCRVNTNNYNIIQCDSFTVPSGNKTYTTPGTYTVNDTLVSNCGLDSLFVISLTILSNIDTNITVNGYLMSANQNGANYQWINCSNSNAIIAGATNQSFTPTINGDYAVIISFANCSDTSRCINISGLGYGIKNQSNLYRIYPNPTTGDLQIKYDFDEHSKYSIEVFDLIGRSLLIKQIDAANAIIELNAFSKGSYIIKLYEDNNTMLTEKLIKL